MVTVTQATNYFWSESEKGKGLRACYTAVKRKYGVTMAESVRKRVRNDAHRPGSGFDPDAHGLRKFFDLSKRYK